MSERGANKKWYRVNKFDKTITPIFAFRETDAYVYVEGYDGNERRMKKMSDFGAFFETITEAVEYLLDLTEKELVWNKEEMARLSEKRHKLNIERQSANDLLGYLSLNGEDWADKVLDTAVEDEAKKYYPGDARTKIDAFNKVIRDIKDSVK